MGKIGKQAESRYYFDTYCGYLIAGEEELQAHIDDGGNQNTIYDLGELVCDTTIDLGEKVADGQPAPEWRDREYLLKFGRWINAMIKDYDDDASLNESVLKRAHHIGIGPSVYSFIHRRAFCSLGKFYKELGFNDTRRVKVFDDWSMEDFVKHIKNVGGKIGRRPSEKDIDKLFRKSTKYPSCDHITARFGKFRTAVELAGYVVIHDWETEDYIAWGVKFMLANNGRRLTQHIEEILSPKKLGPSASQLGIKFGSLKKYHDIVQQAYEDDLQRREKDRSEKLFEINSRLREGSLPNELFVGADTEDEVLLRYSKFIVADFLLGENYKNTKLSISTEGNPTVRERGFVKSLIYANNSITAGDIENAALFNHVFDYIWPMDEYMETLRIPNDKLSKETQ